MPSSVDFLNFSSINSHQMAILDYKFLKSICLRGSHFPSPSKHWSDYFWGEPENCLSQWYIYLMLYIYLLLIGIFIQQQNSLPMKFVAFTQNCSFIMYHPQ